MCVTFGITLEQAHAGEDPSGVWNIKHLNWNLIEVAKDIIQTSWLSSETPRNISALDYKLYHMMVSLSDGVFIWCTTEDTTVMNLAVKTSETLLFVMDMIKWFL